MVNHGDQDVFVSRELEQVYPQRDCSGDVEPLVHSADNLIGNLFGRNHRVTKRNVDVVENPLERPFGIVRENGPQGFVAKNDVRQRFSESH